MGNQMAAVSLEDRAEALRQDRGDTVAIDDIRQVVGSLVEGTTPSADLHQVAVELRELLQFIGSAKDELVGMQPKSLSNRDIPHAADHLDAIVKATEDAAGIIMNAAETASEVGTEIAGDQGERLTEISTQLFEASSFQDLTGQRITKVARTLAHLEGRLNALADAIGDDYIEPEDDPEKDSEGIVMNDEELLHGPQLEGEGNSQDEIDALLASFD